MFQKFTHYARLYDQLWKTKSYFAVKHEDIMVAVYYHLRSMHHGQLTQLHDHRH